MYAYAKFKIYKYFDYKKIYAFCSMYGYRGIACAIRWYWYYAYVQEMVINN